MLLALTISFGCILWTNFKAKCAELCLSISTVWNINSELCLWCGSLRGRDIWNNFLGVHTKCLPLSLTGTGSCTANVLLVCMMLKHLKCSPHAVGCFMSLLHETSCYLFFLFKKQPPKLSSYVMKGHAVQNEESDVATTQSFFFTFVLCRQILCECVFLSSTSDFVIYDFQYLQPDSLFTLSNTV